jgi:hypothetical protein
MKTAILLLISILPGCLFGQTKNQKRINFTKYDFSKKIQPIAPENVFSDSTFNIWCGSVIQG